MAIWGQAEKRQDLELSMQREKSKSSMKERLRRKEETLRRKEERLRRK
jgi:hypothetical protein